jgi:hypothetical protein
LNDRSSQSAQEEKWYRNGLRFECMQCGHCCTGDAGYVWVTCEEIEALAAAVRELDLDQFERTYVRKVGVRRSLKEFADGDCVFFDRETRTCRVYAARPRQCRTWPFWTSNLRSTADWEQTCAACPGSGKGRLYDLHEIESLRNVMHI